MVGYLNKQSKYAMQDEVLIAGFGRRGHAVGDIPGVRFKARLMLRTVPATSTIQFLEPCEMQPQSMRALKPAMLSKSYLCFFIAHVKLCRSCGCAVSPCFGDVHI